MSLLGRSSPSIVNILNYNYSYLAARHVEKKLYRSKTYIIPALWKSTAQSKSDTTSNYCAPSQETVSFDEMLARRRREASRSILVQVHSEQSCSDLHEYCSRHGEVKGMHHYSMPGYLHFVVVEFQHKSDVDHILDVSNHFNKKDIVPVRSPFLWFRAPKKSPKTKPSTPKPSALVETNGNTPPSSEELRGSMQVAESLSEQITILHRATSLSDLGSRLRFLTARQIELAVTGLFPQVMVLPFGSSVNGFGKAACDLDLVLLADKDNDTDDENDNCRLVFHAKTALANGRTQVQRHMETLGDVCQLLLPGCSHVRRILQARVPIIKYHQDLTGVECDLSMTNMTAVYMSELLYVLGACDWRVRPLVFAVRSWAREVGLTNPTPGRWITNFSLTLLVLFYLQQHGKRRYPVLPTLNTLISLAGSGDRRITSDGINCTFLRNIPRLCSYMSSSPNTDDLENLFTGFFEFYSSFDFGTHAISLANGVAVTKPEHSPLYIANPVERGLNVSKNVSHEETERLRIELRNAAWLLDTALEKADQPWGLTALFEAPKLAAKGRNIFYIPSRKSVPPRIMDVSELFQQDAEAKSSSDVQVSLDDLQSNKPKTTKAVKVSGRLRRR